MPEYPLDDGQMSRFETDGALILPSFLGDTWVQRLRAGAERLQQREAREGRPVQYFDRQRLWEHDEDLKSVCFESPAAALAARLLAADKINLLYDQMFVKEPASNVRTVWHNDLPNWPVRGRQIATVWIALDPIDEDNGAMEFVRGSHAWERWYPPFNTDLDGRFLNLYEDGMREGFEPALPDVDRDRHEILSWDMLPGDAIAFHCLTVHGAHGNSRGDRRRRGYSVRFAGPEIRYYAGDVVNLGITNDALRDGDRLDSDQYPVVYRH